MSASEGRVEAVGEFIKRTHVWKFIWKGRELRRDLEVAKDENARSQAQASIQERRERLRTGVALIGALAIVVAYAGLRSQVTGLRDQEQRARYQAVAERGLDVDKLFIDHPNLAPYFQSISGGVATTPTGSEVPGASAAASFVLDYFSYLYNEMVDQGIVGADKRFTPNHGDTIWGAWSQYVYDQISHSPAMCAAIDLYINEYSKDFAKAIGELRACPAHP